MCSLCRKLMLFIMLLTLSSCGGGAFSLVEGGIGGSGISQGSIQGFGSVYVNGVRFDTSTAQITETGGAVITQAELREGMVVTVQGTINADGTTGIAETITYAEVLHGPITTNDGVSTIVMMGQTVIIDANTLFDSVAGIADLDVGDVIEVSGFYTVDKSVYATYVELEPATVHEIIGVVTQVNGLTFNIGNLIVNWAGTANIQSGDLVDVKGVINVSNELDASSVDVLNSFLEVDDADDAELEGLVTSSCGATAPCSFEIGLITVNVDDATEFEGGALTDIQPGLRIEVEGSLVNGVINAESISIEDNIRLIADVSAINANTLVMEYGAIDINVIVNANVTQFDGFTSIADINVGDHLVINARKAGSDVVAVRIESSLGNMDLRLQAPVSIITEPQLTLLGVTIDTSGLNYADTNGIVINQAGFFGLLSMGTIVEFEGNIDAGGLVWERVKIE